MPSQNDERKQKKSLGKLMTAFYGHCAVKAVSKSISALAEFLCKCTMMRLKVD